VLQFLLLIENLLAFGAETFLLSKQPTCEWAMEWVIFPG